MAAVYLSSVSTLPDILLYSAAAAAAAGIALAPLAGSLFRKGSLLLFLLSFSLLTALVINVSYRRGENRGSRSVYRITGLTGLVLEDSRPVGGGKNSCVIRMTASTGEDCTEVAERGEYIVFYSGRRIYFKGQIIRVGSSPAVLEGTEFVFAGKREIFSVGWRNGVYTFRSSLIRMVEKKTAYLTPVAGSLLSAFLLGRKDSYKNPVFENFIHAGAAHLLALSGMHLGILAGAALYILTPILGKRRAFYVSIPIMIFYLFLAGASPSLLRALLLMILAGIILLEYGNPHLPHLLVVVIMIHLLLNPEAADSISFKLSYLALAGILLFWGPLYRIFPGIIPPCVRGILSASISAQITTLPVVVSCFGVVYPSGIFSSLILAPLVAFFLLAGIIYILLPSTAAGVFSLFMNIVEKMLSGSAGIFSKFPSLPLPAGKAPLIAAMEAVLLTLIILAGILADKRHNGTFKKLRLGK